ncbi:SDR family oxidoreductase [Neobacillus mesonae]|nr:SDR family oxidoreductase [Neobacillus mesonae]
MSNIQGKVIAITGASSGIGEAAARQLASQGAHVVLGARRIERLASLAAELEAEGASVQYFSLDVTQKDQMEGFIQQAYRTYGRVDVIVNNAGIMPLSPMEALRTEEWDQMIDVNIRGVLHGISAGLPIMKKQGYGQFVNVSSIGGHSVTPTAAVYCATKYAVLAISEGLRQENSDIQVTVISPGVTESELADRISDDEARTAMKEYRRISIPADAIARAISYAIDQPHDVDINEVIVRPTASVG